MAISQGGSAGLAAGGAPPVEDGGSGGAGANVEQLEVCARLNKTRILSNLVMRDFDQAVYFDACTHWTTLLYTPMQHPDWANHLVAWNLGFWGCQGDGVSDFALVYKTPPLSAGDAELLIDHYMEAATTELQLSPPEADEMRAALERLAEPLVTDPSTSPSHECLGSGGAGGASGAAGSGGAG